MELSLALPGKKAGKEKVSLSDESFGKEYNEPLVHQTVVTYMAGARQGSVKQKTDLKYVAVVVSLGVKKVLVERVLVLSAAPIWRSGGVTFAASHAITKKLNKKMYRGAMQCILSELVRQERLFVVNDFALDSHKTKGLVSKLKEFELDNVLIISEEVDENLYLAARNLT